MIVYKFRVEKRDFDELKNRQFIIRKSEKEYRPLERVEFHEFENGEASGRVLKGLITSVDDDLEGLLPKYKIISFVRRQ